MHWGGTPEGHRYPAFIAKHALLAKHKHPTHQPGLRLLTCVDATWLRMLGLVLGSTTVEPSLQCIPVSNTVSALSLLLPIGWKAAKALDSVPS